MRRVYCIITESTGGSVLLRSSAGGWELPYFDTPAGECVDLQAWDTPALLEVVGAAVPMDIAPTYAMDATLSEDMPVVAGFEARGGEAAVVGGWEWVSAGSLDAYLGRAVELALARGHFAGREPGVESGIIPWLRPGWFAEAEAWIREELSALGVGLKSDPEPVTSRFTGVALQMETDVGRVYFKATSQVFCREVPITLELSAWQPRRIPEPLTADLDRGWMLTREVMGPTLGQVAAVEVWENAVRAYAEMQRASLRALAEGSLNSLYDWRPETVSRDLDVLLAELEWLQTGYGEPLSEGETDALRRGAPRLKDLCLEVAGRGVPSALEHHDLHPGNVRIADGAPVFLDWAWSCVSHPFLSMLSLVPEERLPPAVLPARSRLLGAYFEVWGERGCARDLESLLDLVRRWMVIEYAAADAEWVRAYLKALGPKTPPPNSYLAWTLKTRQYYLVKCLRRMAGLLST